MEELTTEEETNKILIIQPSSYELKIGLSNSEEPKIIPHCLIDFVKCEKEDNFYYEEKKVNQEEEKEIHQTKHEVIKNIQEISEKNRRTIKEKFIIRKTTKEEKIESEKLNEKELIGIKAIEYSKNNSEGNLFYPIKSGYFNTCTNRSLLYVSDCLEKIWKSEIEKLISKEEYEETSVFYILPDKFDKVEIQYVLKILLKNFGFKEVFLHTENICSAFSVGLSSVCVVDFGETKTSVSFINEGLSVKKSQHVLPYGGISMSKLLFELLNEEKLTKFPLTNFSDSIQRRIFTEIREKHSHLHPGDEFFQNATFKFNETTYEVDIGDSCYLSALGFFYPELYLPYSEFDHENRVSSFEDFEEKKKKEKKKRERKPLDEMIVDSIEKSEVDLLSSNKKKAKIEVLLVGGNSLIPGLTQILEKRLIEHYSKKFPNVTIKVNVMTTLKYFQPQISSWKGAQIVTLLESNKEMWINRKEFDTLGLKIVKEKVPFKF
eukprot:gene7379-11701_t